MFKVRTYNQISALGLNRFPRDRYEIASECSRPDALLLRSYKLHDEPIADSVKAVARAGAGVNNIPVKEYTRKGIVVFNTPGANANAVKELVLAGMLLASRDIHGGINYVRNLDQIKDGQEMSQLVEKAKKRFAGGEIAGKILGVVGLGAIGALVANTGLSLGMKVVGYDPGLSIDAAWQLSSQVEKMENLPTLFGKADFVTLHVPANDATRNLINAETLRYFKPTARLLNFARAEIVDTSALIAALDNNQLAGYITDFPVPELSSREDVIQIPHLGASTEEAEDNCATMAADQLMDFLENGNIKNSVNFPSIQMSRVGGYRLAFSNDNVPKVLGNVLSLLADRSINVIDMVNKSRENVAYNIIDIETEPTDELMEAIRQVSGVIRAGVV